MKNPKAVDLLIIGAGPVGCVIAERAASQLGWECLLIDKRPHIAGNCYDRPHENGVLIHQYGPHMFRTSNPDLINYLSAFTEWHPYTHIVKSSVNGKLYPFPINLETLELFYNRTLTPEEAEKLLDSVRVPSDTPANSEEFVLSRVGPDLYQAFYLNYTLKQWGRHPRDLAPSVCGRIPIRLNREERFTDQKFQVMPAKGFTAMFANMINHPKIHLQLETDYAAVRDAIRPKKATVYCGPIDEYFNHQLGSLSWRSLDFEFKTYQEDYHQPCSVINYPNEYDYTRSFESKHITGQQHPETVVCYEYPKEAGDPYYPVPSESETGLYRQYEALAKQETEKKNIFFVGRLAQYQYINSDEAIERALETFEKLREIAK